MYSKYENKDSSIDFTDCFAYGRYKCKALSEFVCKECGECSFYLPKHVYEEKISSLLSDRYER